jgi:hypothetical protein
MSAPDQPQSRQPVLADDVDQLVEFVEGESVSKSQPLFVDEVDGLVEFEESAERPLSPSGAPTPSQGDPIEGQDAVAGSNG